MKIDALLEIFSDGKWAKMSTTTREGVAREAPKNIPPKRLLMVSTSRFLAMCRALSMHFKPMCAELDFSRGIWAAARDGEEDRIRHLLSRFIKATSAHLPYNLSS